MNVTLSLSAEPAGYFMETYLCGLQASGLLPTSTSVVWTPDILKPSEGNSFDESMLFPLSEVSFDKRSCQSRIRMLEVSVGHLEEGTA